MAKATKKQALGRGLSALLKDPENDIQSATDRNADKVVGNIVELDIDAIEVNPFQPRSSFNEEALARVGQFDTGTGRHSTDYRPETGF